MSAKVILICGKIASGKSFYCENLRKSENAVVLSCDEITLGILGKDLGEKHDEYTDRIKEYLYAKSLEIIEIGTNVILDWGFWKKADRNFARDFFKSRNIPCEFHYIDVSDNMWEANINKRNCEVLSGTTNAYYVDEGLRKKLNTLFEAPQKSEIDVWFCNDYIQNHDTD